MLLINMKLEHTDQYADQWQGRTSCFPWSHTGVRRYEMVLILNCTVFMASTTSNFVFLCQVQLTILCFCCKYNLQFYVFVAGTTYNFLSLLQVQLFTIFLLQVRLPPQPSSDCVSPPVCSSVLCLHAGTQISYCAYMLVHKYLLLTCWYTSILYCFLLNQYYILVQTSFSLHEN